MLVVVSLLIFVLVVKSSGSRIKVTLEERLAETQDTLARACMERDTTQFQTVLQGGSGVGRFYDFWRSTKARLRGESFSKEHGNQ